MIKAIDLVNKFIEYELKEYGYVWSFNGEIYTKEIAEAYKRKLRPTSAHRNPETYWTEDCKKWYGHNVADCSGGIVSAMRDLANPNYGDRTANTFFKQCVKTGKIDDIPEVPGLCVWRSGHIELYKGNGYSIGFRSTERGCCTSKLSDGSFTHYGYLKDVDYGEATQFVFKITTPYMRGNNVKQLQYLLTECGYFSSKCDGIYGPDTNNAFMEFLKAHNGNQR